LIWIKIPGVGNTYEERHSTFIEEVVMRKPIAITRRETRGIEATDMAVIVALLALAITLTVTAFDKIHM
jgi:hypothetical protein